MTRVALWSLCAGVSYAASFQSPGPALFPIASDKAQPRQRVVTVGFWGCGGSSKVFGPEIEDINRPYSFPMSAPYEGLADFHGILGQFPELKREALDPEKMGFIRMVPHLWYGVRPDSPDHMVFSGRAGWTGDFSWFPRRYPKIPSGWRVVGETKVRVRLDISFPNPAYAGGGIGVTIKEPKDWRLSEIGLQSGVSYVAGWESAWESPFSEWKSPKPAKGGLSELSMDPIVIAEVVETTIENPATRERRILKTPTGWVVSAGIFKSGF